jgi:hypothetical protein
MASWCYGLVLDDDELKVCEVYFRRKHYIGVSIITDKDINKKNLKMIKEDLAKIDRYFYFKDEKLKVKKF